MHSHLQPFQNSKYNLPAYLLLTGDSLTFNLIMCETPTRGMDYSSLQIAYLVSSLFFQLILSFQSIVKCVHASIQLKAREPKE